MDLIFGKIYANSSEILLFLAIFFAGFATFLTRILPYLFFKNKKPSPVLLYLQKNMGQFIMIILVFYALSGTNFAKFPYGLPEISAAILAIILQITAKNALLSIAASTIFYMIFSKLFI